MVSTFSVLEQSCSVESASIVASNEAVRHVRTVVERNLTPSIGGIVGVEPESVVWHQGISEGIESIVVARSSVDNVPGSRRVVQFIGIDNTVCDGRHTLVCMEMPSKIKVHAVLEEKRLECERAIRADASR